MKAISLWQPWASAIALGIKSIETRGWRPPCGTLRQPLAIHAARHDDRASRDFFCREVLRKPEIADLFARVGIVEFDALPFGAIVCTTSLLGAFSTNCNPPAYLAARKDDELWGNFSPGRWAWFLGPVTRITPAVPCIGSQGFFEWNLPADLRTRSLP